MPTMQVGGNLDIYYDVDDFTDPWSRKEHVLLIPGVCDSGEVWFGVAPHFIRHYRLVRPDMRGFGRSTPMVNFEYSLDRLRDDYLRLLDGLGIDEAHIVTRRSGGFVTLHLAATHPDRVGSVVIMSSPLSASGIPTPNSPGLRDAYRTGGIRAWAAAGNPPRMGSTAPAAVSEWMVDFMVKNGPVPSLESFFESEKTIDLNVNFTAVSCPVLYMTIANSRFGSLDSVKEVLKLIPRSELMVLPGDGHDIAVLQPDRAGSEALKFIQRHSKA